MYFDFRKISVLRRHEWDKFPWQNRQTMLMEPEEVKPKAIAKRKITIKIIDAPVPGGMLDIEVDEDATFEFVLRRLRKKAHKLGGQPFDLCPVLGEGDDAVDPAQIVTELIATAGFTFKVVLPVPPGAAPEPEPAAPVSAPAATADEMAPATAPAESAAAPASAAPAISAPKSARKLKKEKVERPPVSSRWWQDAMIGGSLLVANPNSPRANRSSSSPRRRSADDALDLYAGIDWLDHANDLGRAERGVTKYIPPPSHKPLCYRSAMPEHRTASPLASPHKLSPRTATPSPSTIRSSSPALSSPSLSPHAHTPPRRLYADLEAAASSPSRSHPAATPLAPNHVASTIQAPIPAHAIPWHQSVIKASPPKHIVTSPPLPATSADHPAVSILPALPWKMRGVVKSIGVPRPPSPPPRPPSPPPREPSPPPRQPSPPPRPPSPPPPPREKPAATKPRPPPATREKVSHRPVALFDVAVETWPAAVASSDPLTTAPTTELAAGPSRELLRQPERTPSPSGRHASSRHASGRHASSRHASSRHADAGTDEGRSSATGRSATGRSAAASGTAGSVRPLAQSLPQPAPSSFGLGVTCCACCGVEPAQRVCCEQCGLVYCSHEHRAVGLEALGHAHSCGRPPPTPESLRSSAASPSELAAVLIEFGQAQSRLAKLAMAALCSALEERAADEAALRQAWQHLSGTNLAPYLVAVMAKYEDEPKLLSLACKLFSRIGEAEAMGDSLAEQAATAGAFEAVTAALRLHVADAGVLRWASTATLTLTHGSASRSAAALKAGAGAALTDALRGVDAAEGSVQQKALTQRSLHVALRWLAWQQSLLGQHGD